MPLPLLLTLICLAALLSAVVLVCRHYLHFAIFRHADQPAGPGDVLPGEGDPGFAPYLPLMREGEAWFLAQHPEQVSVASRDGLRLAGYYLPCPGAHRTLLLAHGYRSYGLHDFSCILRFYHEHGCNLLLIDQRAHGRSEGKYIGFGVLERYDILTWLDFLNSRPDRNNDLFLDGVSMGAATVLMAAGLPLPGNVRGIIADCGFTSPEDIFSHILKDKMHLPKYPLMPLLSFACRLVAGYGFRDASTIDALAVNTLPVLFVHGGEDDFVPTDMSRRNHAAYKAEKQLVIVPGAGHAQSYLVDPDACNRTLLTFLEHCSR